MTLKPNQGFGVLEAKLLCMEDCHCQGFLLFYKIVYKNFSKISLNPLAE